MSYVTEALRAVAEKALRRLRQAPAAHATMALTCAVTVTQVLAPRLFPGVDLHEALTAKPYCLSRGELWRPLTANLVHVFGIPHLLANMVALCLAGPPVERAFGAIGFLILYAVPGCAALAVHTVLGRGGSGASAAIVGILGALLVHSFMHRGESSSLKRHLILAAVLSGVILVSGLLLDGRTLPGIGFVRVANDAHFMGFAVGLLLGVGSECLRRHWCRPTCECSRRGSSGERPR